MTPIVKPARDLKPGDKLWRSHRITGIEYASEPILRITLDDGSTRAVHPTQYLRIEP